MMDFFRETWQFINSFSPWLSAVGTIIAVIVALYLARLDKRIRLRVSAGHRLVFSAGASIPENPDEYLVINIVNSGYRTA
jgi:multisubunit Na+/H+ antiporter MnhE subunit